MACEVPKVEKVHGSGPDALKSLMFVLVGLHLVPTEDRAFFHCVFAFRIGWSA